MVWSRQPRSGGVRNWPDQRGSTGAASSLVLPLGAAVTGAAALVVDLFAGEQPSHALALVALVVAITASARRVAPRFRGLLQLTCASVISQPALHLAGKVVRTDPEHAHGAMQTLPPDLLTLGQLVLSVLIVVAVLISGGLAEQLAGRVWARVRQLLRPPATVGRLAVGGIRAERRGSMLRWCGWALRSGLRGPPVGVMAG